MSLHDWVTLVACSLLGAGAGWALGGPLAAIIAVLVGAVFATAANRFMVRSAVAIAVFAGTAVGAVLGASIVGILCRPGSCVVMQSVAAVLLGAGAFVGVGLVAALVTRSFDEYRETTAPPDDGTTR